MTELDFGVQLDLSGPELIVAISRYRGTRAESGTSRISLLTDASSLHWNEVGRGQDVNNSSTNSNDDFCKEKDCVAFPIHLHQESSDSADKSDVAINSIEMATYISKTIEQEQKQQQRQSKISRQTSREQLIKPDSESVDLASQKSDEDIPNGKGTSFKLRHSGESIRVGTITRRLRNLDFKVTTNYSLL